MHDRTVASAAKDRIAQLEPDPELEHWVFDMLECLFEQWRGSSVVVETAADREQL